MTCQTTCICGAPSSADKRDNQCGRASTLARRATHFVRRRWRAYWDWRGRQVTIMLLMALDERTLRDIGIKPSEIESMVRNGSDRCRRYDAAWLFRAHK